MTATRLIFIIGQTASGKGAVAFDLARRINAELVSLDSMKVYRGMDIGTAKPPADRRDAVRYHLLDVADPTEHFSTALYLQHAEAAIEDILSRRAVPLFAGGTALYLKAITEGLFKGPSADAEFRARIREEAALQGTEALHCRLAKVDPAAASKIHPNDLRRIERALEVFEKTGVRISELQQQFGSPNTKYNSLLFGLRRTRDDLHDRIGRRVDLMMEKGLLDEVRRLAAGPPLGKEASQAVGYKELLAHLRGENTLPEAIDLIKLHTRQFAKAQMTWFKRIPNIHWLDLAPDAPPASTAAEIEQLVISHQ